MKRDLVRRWERDVERGDEVMYGCGEDIDGWAWGGEGCWSADGVGHEMYACATVNASAGSDVKGKERDNTSVSIVTQCEYSNTV